MQRPLEAPTASMRRLAGACSSMQAGAA